MLNAGIVHHRIWTHTFHSNLTYSRMQTDSDIGDTPLNWAGWLPASQNWNTHRRIIAFALHVLHITLSRKSNTNISLAFDNNVAVTIHGLGSFAMCAVGRCVRMRGGCTSCRHVTFRQTHARQAFNRNKPVRTISRIPFVSARSQCTME